MTDRPLEQHLRRLFAENPDDAAAFRDRLAAVAAVQQTSMAGAFRRAVDALPDESRTALAQLLGDPVPAGASAGTRARLRLVHSAGQESEGK